MLIFMFDAIIPGRWTRTGDIMARGNAPGNNCAVLIQNRGLYVLFREVNKFFRRLEQAIIKAGYEFQYGVVDCTDRSRNGYTELANKAKAMTSHRNVNGTAVT